MSAIYIYLEELLRIHFQVIEDFGGIHGVRDEGRLQSVINAPKQEIFGAGQYQTVYEKAAVYLRNIVSDHPFLDGNKRTAVTICGIFLARNRVSLIASPKELEEFTVQVAVKHFTIAEITAWLTEHTK